MTRMTLCIIFAVIAFGVTIYYTIMDTPGPYLEQQYVRVSSVEMDYFAPLKCNYGKHRLTYNFTATRANGETVTGYVCYTKGNVFGLADPVIHEDQ